MADDGRELRSVHTGQLWKTPLPVMARKSEDLSLLEEGPRFLPKLAEHGVGALLREVPTTLQVNVGKRCNQACHHCHVEAGPKRTESMSESVARRLVELMAKSPSLKTVDITGGAPELNPHFRFLVAEARRRSLEVIDRCNLTILFEPGMETLGAFLAKHQVKVVASLPCYLESNVDEQRGRGVFDKSIAAIRLLNALGYGQDGSGLTLDLVYNPTRPVLPPPQASLEARYKQELRERYGLRFNQLLTITNMPIKRFAHQLARDGQWDAYMRLLVQSFNPSTVPALMCRHLVSVAHDGRLFDCDFNQMLDLPLNGRRTEHQEAASRESVIWQEHVEHGGSQRGVDGVPRTVWDVNTLDELGGAGIATGAHCFGCTAGAGSSCSGALG